MNLEKAEKKIEHYTYNMSSLLGTGSFSKVFLGRDTKSGMEVAIKAIDRRALHNEYTLNLLANEISIMKKLVHPNLVRLFDVYEIDNFTYMMLEYCKDGDVQRMIAKRGRLNENESLHILKEVISGYKELLKHGIIHRDLKPANIFISKGVYKIGDFGFSKDISNSNSLLTSIVGTPLYMSPQGLQNIAYSVKTDVWSLGIIYYEMIYGTTPWPCEDPRELIQLVNTQPLYFPSCVIVSQQSKELLDRMLRFVDEERISFEELFVHPLVNSEKVSVNIHPMISKRYQDDLLMEYFSREFMKNDQILFGHLNFLSLLKRVKGLIPIIQPYFPQNDTSIDKLTFLLSKHSMARLATLSKLTDGKENILALSEWKAFLNSEQYTNFYQNVQQMATQSKETFNSASSKLKSSESDFAEDKEFKLFQETALEENSEFYLKLKKLLAKLVNAVVEVLKEKEMAIYDQNFVAFNNMLMHYLDSCLQGQEKAIQMMQSLPPPRSILEDFSRKALVLEKAE